MTRRLWVAVILLGLLLAACGGGGEAETSSPGENAGDAAHGEEMFQRTVIGANAAPGCATCHSLEPDVRIVGPSMAGIGERAGSEVEGMTADEYLHQSIVEPNAHVVEGFTAGLMYQNYGEDLTEQEINDLVAYLKTLQ